MIMGESLNGRLSSFQKEFRPLQSQMHGNALGTGRATLHKPAPSSAQLFRSMGFVSVIIVSALFALGLPLVLL